MLYVSIHRYVKHVKLHFMYFEKDIFEPFPEVRDQVTGDWLPMSESMKASAMRRQMSMNSVARMSARNTRAMLNMITSILK